MAKLRINEVLKEQGKTAKELAEMMGKSPQHINGIIHGNGGLNTLQKVADVLGVPISSLFADYEKKQDNVITCPKCGAKIGIKVDEK